MEGSSDMTDVTIFGAGNMGSAIAGILTDGGSTVEHITTSSKDPAVSGDIVILAVPYAAFNDIIARYGAQLAGKIVVDITNPLDFSTFSLIVPPGSSAAAELAGKLPASRVLKAFNTNFAATLASKTIGSQPVTVLVAGDDAVAKSALAGAVAAGGVTVIDAGPLARARELEAVAYLQMNLAVAEKIGWAGGLSVVK
jgi:predicted dinucleotide-binding enzyme